MSGHLELDPIELGFKRPFTREVAETLRLRNPGTEPVAFKVKTTAPKQYCVRPNSGRIEGGEVVEVSVLLQPMKEEPPLEARCKDKFLVQSIAITADKEVNNVAAIWSNLEQTSKSSIQEKKIRVNFLAADSSAAAGAAVSTPTRSAHSNAESTAYDSPAASTPQQHSSAFTPGAVSTPASRPDQSSATSSSQANGGAQSGFGAAVTNAIPTSTEELQAQLAEAQATISRLTSQAAESVGLRQRKGDASSVSSSGQSTAYGSQQTAPSGVPVPIAAALCLLSFLLAYLLF